MADERPPSEVVGTVGAGATIEAMRRLVEPIAIALATSTGLYLIGSVYTDAYYGRMSIEPTSLDLSPTFVGVQSLHVLQSLLGYPSTLLVYYLVYRFLQSRFGWFKPDPRRRRWVAAIVILLTNLLIVLPLLLAAGEAMFERPYPSSSTVGDVTILLSNVAFLLLVYACWLSLGQRRFLANEIRERKLLPIALISLAYLLGALVSTADSGAAAAETFMLGDADATLAVNLTLSEGVPTIPAGAELLLVAARNSNYFVVERQTFPPDPQPRSHIIPFSSVAFADVRRINPAAQELDAPLDPFALAPATPATP